jgi:hypothetical protein
MCYGCWEDEGCPAIDNDSVRKAAEAAHELDPFGAFHIVVEDWNVDDGNIEFCMKEDDATEQELAWGRLLLSMSFDERLSALALADGFWGPPATYPPPLGL